MFNTAMLSAALLASPTIPTPTKFTNVGAGVTRYVVAGVLQPGATLETVQGQVRKPGNGEPVFRMDKPWVNPTPTSPDLTTQSSPVRSVRMLR